MKTNDLRSLQALRQLREQRASSQLAAQQQRCRATHDALDDAKEKMRLHRETVAREAQKVYGLFSEGLSINAWHAAQAQLDELADGQQQLEGSVDQVAETLDVQEREREVFRLARMARQRQSEACQSLLEVRVQDERRAGERREEADEIPRTSPAGAP
ncbi:Myosin heavy chain B (MHC B) [Pseudomonas syringae]|uniref:Myosin heavy chain B (MHC B) n=1 Tax=Pseudomonas syringae TaxID=317 RepID=A0A1C7Z2A6_PSESX|nr:hypothetical protein [Pseudomonas syringae]OCR23196.1 Myosin heavy chain B (MHC B) [Pseudomonas syringae]